ncbi:hypothetical protein BC831DRAFT_511459 [Entophlyctis helioformis]|nr:hypothetical protein BC831DRAFT_511459 [Entophlyctis helioformis]
MYVNVTASAEAKAASAQLLQIVHEQSIEPDDYMVLNTGKKKTEYRGRISTRVAPADTFAVIHDEATNLLNELNGLKNRRISKGNSITLVNQQQTAIALLQKVIEQAAAGPPPLLPKSSDNDRPEQAHRKKLLIGVLDDTNTTAPFQFSEETEAAHAKENAERAEKAATENTIKKNKKKSGRL